MNNYHLKQSGKTIFLNFFRSFFTIPFLENIIVKLSLNNSSTVIQKLIPPDYLYKTNSFRMVTREGINYKLDISHVVDHYLYFGIKDKSYETIIETIKNSKTILDIGANIGTTALYYASINAEAKILAFEPHPITFKRASENIQLNKFKNIQLINLGLGEHKEIVKLYEVNEHNPGMNRIIAENKNLPYKEIEIDSLDNILSERQISKIDFIKIDVEGFEYAVLAGGKKSIMQSKPIMFIELDDNNMRENNKSARELIELLLSFGYREIFRADNLIPVTATDNFNNCHYDIIAK